MIHAPSAKELVDLFRLKQRGRQRGRDNLPAAQQPTLDDVETGVVDHCNRLYAAKRDEYQKNRPIFEERMRPPAENLGADALVERACKEMKDAVARERPDLEGLAREAQDAIGELNRFRREEGRTADADFPDSPTLHLGILAALLVVETLINGLFFGANLVDGWLAAMSYAALISVVNVGALGYVAAMMFREVAHRDPRRRVGGMTALVVIAAVALSWNLFVAHYREALSPDYPPAPNALAAADAEEFPEDERDLDALEDDAADSGVAADVAVAGFAADAGDFPISQNRQADGTSSCWIGPDATDADQEALCLFLASPFGLVGFYSYMLLLIGLAMCVGGALDWFRMDDPYPGYGKRERRLRKCEDKLSDDRLDLLERVKRRRENALGRMRADFVDPVGARQLALGAFDKLNKRYRDLRSFAADLEDSCRGALNLYRTANREARSADEPRLWQELWRSGWVLPGAPSASDIVSVAEAQRRSVEGHAAMKKREAKLAACHDECQELVNEFTKLDLYDKAVP